VPNDGPVKCNCKYFVGAILVNEQEEQTMRVLEDCYCVDKDCTRYLCIDAPVSSSTIPEPGCPFPTVQSQLKLLNEMVCTLAEECFDPILLPNIEGFTQIFIDGCDLEVFPEPPIWIRFSKSNFLVLDPNHDLNLMGTNVTRIVDCHQP